MNATLANMMHKGWKWALIAVVLGLIVYKVRFGPVPVATQPVAVGEVVAEVMGTGTLEAHYQATVSGEGPGLIVELLVDQNDWVKSGQLLARLDDSDLKREVTTQEAVPGQPRGQRWNVSSLMKQGPRRYSGKTV